MTDDARRERLKAALRDNLKRRKAQSRARGSAEPAGAEPAERGDDTRSARGKNEEA